MKNAKKVFAMLIVLALAISMAIPVSAATGSITISDAKNGNTYSIYKIADLAFSGTTDGNGKYAYSIPANDDYPWTAFLIEKNFTLTASADGQTFAVKAPDTITSDSEAAAKLAKDALDFAKKEGAYKNRTGEVIGATATAVASGDSVEFTGLAFGYYLVDTTVGTICSLGTVNGVGTPDVTIRDKHTVPTIDKKANGEDIIDAFIGEEIEYTIDIYVKPGAINYVVTDVLSNGLTYVDDSAEYSDNISDTAVVANGQTLTFTLTDAQVAAIGTGVATITYRATVNANAVIAGEGNTNSATLTYGNTPNTTSDTVDVYTWNLDIDKVDESGNALSGATFALYKDSVADGNGIKLAGTNGTYKFDGLGTATVFSGNKGVYVINGLKSGTYVLREVAAPDGYNKLPNDITITITTTNAKTSVTYAGGNFADDKDLQVVNSAGTVLPSTGATGTIIFIAVGGLMVVAMGVLLVVRKRMSKVVYTR